MDTELKAVGVGCIWVLLTPDGEKVPPPSSLWHWSHSLDCNVYSIECGSAVPPCISAVLPVTLRSRLHLLHLTDAETEAMEVHAIVMAKRLTSQPHAHRPL